jgi:hypothetical protein
MTQIRKINVSEIEGRNPFQNDDAILPNGTLVLYQPDSGSSTPWVMRLHNGVTNGGEPIGESGYSGISGFSGISGYSGIDGESGFSGTSGYSGIDGESGFSGISGYSGISGFSGYSGIDGESGYSGISGFSGTSGYSGTAGPGMIYISTGMSDLLETVLTVNELDYRIANSGIPQIKANNETQGVVWSTVNNANTVLTAGTSLGLASVDTSSYSNLTDTALDFVGYSSVALITIPASGNGYRATFIRSVTASGDRAGIIVEQIFG